MSEIHINPRKIMCEKKMPEMFDPQSYLILLENYVTFSGSENKLMVSRTYNIKFICNYNLRWYPFDSQVKRNIIFFSRIIIFKCNNIFLSSDLQHESYFSKIRRFKFFRHFCLDFYRTIHLIRDHIIDNEKIAY